MEKIAALLLSSETGEWTASGESGGDKVGRWTAGCAMVAFIACDGDLGCAEVKMVHARGERFTGRTKAGNERRELTAGYDC